MMIPSKWNGIASMSTPKSRNNLAHKQPRLPTRAVRDPAITLRRYRGSEDHSIIVDISHAYWDAVGIDSLISSEDVARTLKYLDNFNPQNNLIFAEVAGEPVGFTRVHWHQGSNGRRIYTHLTRLIPENEEQRVYRLLLQFAEKRLRNLAKRHSESIPKHISTTHAKTDRGRSAILEEQSYLLERHFIDMLRNLAQPIPTYPVPDGIEIRTAQPEHYRKILAAMDEAFQDHWGHRPLTESGIRWYFGSSQFQPERWKIAWDGDQVVGTVLSFIDAEENRRFKRKRGYTEDIAVRKPWRRKGVARALIARSLLDLAQQGMDEAALGVDTQNPSGALSLYRSLGYVDVRQYVNYRKVLTF